MGQSNEKSDGSGGEDRGSSSTGSPGEHQSGREHDSSQTDGNHLRKRHHARVPRPHEVEIISEALTQAFTDGDPEKAWVHARELIQISQGLVIEAGKARFEANFGSDKCNNCDGLKTGPGVVATCFQIRQCYFTNVKEGDVGPRKRAIIEGLTSKIPP
jgi:hypothetical protein